MVSFWGLTQTYGLRKELAGELNSRVTRWLDKVLMVHFTGGDRVDPSGPSRGRVTGAAGGGSCCLHTQRVRLIPFNYIPRSIRIDPQTVHPPKQLTPSYVSAKT
eukprot:6740973-Pyramimonas_sp.AAC.1